MSENKKITGNDIAEVTVTCAFTRADFRDSNDDGNYPDTDDGFREWALAMTEEVPFLPSDDPGDVKIVPAEEPTK